MKNKIAQLKIIDYPVCFGEIRFSPERKYKHFNYRENVYYDDFKFVPTKFYKPIIKL